jgi:hypothetical protein
MLNLPLYPRQISVELVSSASDFLRLVYAQSYSVVCLLPVIHVGAGDDLNPDRTALQTVMLSIVLGTGLEQSCQD